VRPEKHQHRNISKRDPTYGVFSASIDESGDTGRGNRPGRALLGASGGVCHNNHHHRLDCRTFRLMAVRFPLHRKSWYEGTNSFVGSFRNGGSPRRKGRIEARLISAEIVRNNLGRTLLFRQIIFGVRNTDAHSGSELAIHVKVYKTGKQLR
jgi:hypothetical protein